MAHFDALLRDATRLLQAGRLAEADAACARILDEAPADADALHLRGLVAYRQARYDDALALLHQALERAPANAAFHGNLGNVLKDAGRRDDAIASYRRALALDPAQVPARNNLGVLLLEAGAHDAALAAFREVLATRPEHFRAHYNLGKALLASRDAVAAEASFRNALSLQPDFAPALADLGLLLLLQRRYDEAIVAFRRRATIEPAAGEAHADLALALHRAGALDDALASYERALAQSPDALGVTCNLCALLQKMCEWDRLAQHVPHVLAALREGRPGVPVGLTTTLPDVTPRMQLDAARANARAYAGRAQMVAQRRIDRSRRLRIGYLSGDFRAHATAYLATEVFELHDRARHEVLLFSHGPDDGSAARARIAAAADRFVDVSSLDDRAAARAIADAGVDLLVDLNGATDNGRIGIAAWRPAPVQVNWLGFPGTLGAAFYDYLVADAVVIPPGAEADYAETVIRLPHCYQSNDRRRARPPGQARAACGLPGDAVVLCCFNQAYKLTRAIFDTWLAVLAAVPRAVLWLYEDNRFAAAALRTRAAAAGIDAGRLVFASHAPPETHLARYAVADLALDTYPCTSHTTASDALWMGCPLVTLTGATFAARVATSLLVSAGVGELAVAGLDDYRALVTALARDDARRDLLRRRTAQAWVSAPLFDTPGFVRDLEAAYAAMADAGAPPADSRTPEFPANAG